MVKRIGKLTIATGEFSLAFYWNHTPYKVTFLGFGHKNPWLFGLFPSPFVRSFAIGPVRFGRTDLNYR